MAQYSKMFASLIGGALGIAASLGLPTDWATAEVQSAIAVLAATIFTYLAPANRPTD